MKQVIKAIYMFILSIILFHAVLPVYKAFAILFVAIWFVLLVGYGNRKNKEFFCNALSISVGIVFAYLTMKILNNGFMIDIDVIEIVLSIIGIIELVLSIYFIIIGNKQINNTKKKDDREIFESRHYDLERIKDFILRVPILGINSGWGNGKTFVMERLYAEPEIKANFEIIQIDLLTCNLDELELILISELEKILNKSKVYSKNSRQLKKMLGEQGILKQIQEYIMDSNTMISSTVIGFKQDVEKIEKNILIVYEDIDRIVDEKTIKKIFAISEKLAGNKIHVIYQYEQHNLEQIGLKREYLEKYIPFIVNLTDMDYRDIVKGLWKELKMEELGVDQKEIIDIPYYVPRNYEVEKALEIAVETSVLLRGISVRKVRIFMQEIKCILQSNKYLAREENRKTVIRFLFIKNFLYQYYEKFSIWKNIEETLLFVYHNCNYTMSELLYKRTNNEFSAVDINEIFSYEENREIYTIFMLLECDFIWENKKASFEDIMNASVQTLIKEEKIERNNRIIWNILGNGKSEFTNMNNAVDKFVREVLNVEANKRKEAWTKYQNDLYEENLVKDNQTVFRIGIDGLHTLFQGFRVMDAPEENWIQLLAFYDEVEKEKSVTVEFIESLNYCDLTKKKVYLKAMEIFCKYQISGNVNAEKSYGKFLENYLKPIYYFGYSRHYEPWMFELHGSIIENINFVKGKLKNVEETMKKEKDYLFISEAKMECELIIRFIQKNLQLINSTKEIKRQKPRVMTSSRTVRKNQEEYDKLNSYLNKQMTEYDKKVFWNKVTKSYNEGKIYPDDLRDIIQKFETFFE